MTWHIMEGREGCAFAKDIQATAVVVDALRASATAALMCDAGAIEIFAVTTVEAALAAKERDAEAVLFGERGGFPPEGFDYGNSPGEATAAQGKRVIFTTTTGTARLVDCIGAPAVAMGTVVNAFAAVEWALAPNRDVVVIPAGKEGDPEFDAQEDWAGAVFLASLSGQSIGEGALLFRDWQRRLELDGLESIFRNSPHGAKLVEIGLAQDIVTCTRPNLTDAVPVLIEPRNGGVLLRDGRKAVQT